MKTVSSGGTGAACCEPKVALESRVITSGADWGRWGCALQAVEKLAEAAGYILGVGQALWQVGCSLSDQGLWAEAEAPLRRSLTILEAELHSDHLDLGPSATVCPAPSHRSSVALCASVQRDAPEGGVPCHLHEQCSRTWNQAQRCPFRRNIRGVAGREVVKLPQ